MQSGDSSNSPSDSPPQRIALCVEYNGSQFHGWQVQSDGIATVQGCLERALAQVANHAVSVICAGRTDAGVHATAQVVHFDAHVGRTERAWVFGTNAHLPEQIRIRWAKAVDGDFHARFSALSRRYLYLVFNSRVRSALFTHELTHEFRELDETRMNKGGQFLVGEHDFTSFRAANCQSKTAMRNVLAVDVSRRNDLVLIDIEANAFLHHMVRIIAGVLMDVGAGEKEPEWIAELLAAKDRNLAGITAPPDGLYLVSVTYPESYDLAHESIGPHFLQLLQ
ncbi:MAG: tRNA pseudouridine(38-40) synthase TruA [Pseudomonadales bacterium]|jgi:tRNA pseudouridine38-40 synthase|nr:tRNA pseudouridine(38-40) synthase TruA [Pseudomonadales bacterium]MDP7358497.1 tRNA pseudouridine(38-40) synthase TruA [Pseudomonadales bacterium]MDP7595084.1 tRNA pseudouridine(38-40) synthase TruA [Pseudomonadales bacterium]HJN51286.1 tRNA pseudouridine(38-40) synthase TruA [Pseudomonadales bacterium]|tara:strand:- start:184 stop:1023 length:840 start_codon:yes stop_codon:yes gene_type:complete